MSLYLEEGTEKVNNLLTSSMNAQQGKEGKKGEQVSEMSSLVKKESEREDFSWGVHWQHATRPRW